jgi:hypothetical protein
MKKFVVFAVFCIFILTTEASAADYQAALSRHNTLLTSHDPERYARFIAGGNTISAEGFFGDRVIEGFHVSAVFTGETENSFSRNPDGSFTASFSGIPAAEVSRALIVLTFGDGSALSYRAEYSETSGWFFGDNGLAASTAAALESYRVISPEISANYMSASLCPDEIRETRERLNEIVYIVTAGLVCDYQKAKALSRWVAENIVYDRDASETEVTEETVSVATTLRLRRSVCIGIANTYAALLESAGIKALNIKGGVISSDVPYERLPYDTTVHEWVAFWFEEQNRWVYADPTWDRMGFFEDGNYQHRPSVMKYFDISGLALSFDHRGDRAELRQFTIDSDAGFDAGIETHDESESIAGDNALVVPFDGINGRTESSAPTVPFDGINGRTESSADGINGRTESSAPTPSPSHLTEDNSILIAVIIALSLISVSVIIIMLKYRKS